MLRRMTALLALMSMLLVGCGGGADGNNANTAAEASPTSTTLVCPTENTRKFAKTRFVADVGGAAFLTRRYIYQPYQAGKFQQGAEGRTVALLKAAAAGAASIKLLQNATENAKADPTLCRTLGEPLTRVTKSLGGITDQLKNCTFNAGAIGGIISQFDQLRGIAGKAGIPVQETPRNL